VWDEVLTSRAHFCITVSPSVLSQVLSANSGRPFKVDLALADYGHMDENRGYAAQDAGPITRPVIALTLGMTFEAPEIRFSFQGALGPIDPRSVSYRSSSRPHSITFRLSFSISEDNLPLHVVDGLAHSAIREYISAARGVGAANPSFERRAPASRVPPPNSNV
jgi:hypothetical protein